MSEAPLNSAHDEDDDDRDLEDDDEDASDIIIHERRMRSFEPSFGNDALIDAVVAHFDRHVGQATRVLHEIISDLVHVDIHIIPADDDRPFVVLYTSGMSERPMHLPEGYDGPRFAELFIILPEDWNLTEEGFEDEDNYWPIRWLKELARLPHEYETWLGPGHTVPHGDPPEPFAPGTELCCMMATPPLAFEEDFAEIRRGEDGEDTIGILMLMPLYIEEMECKLKKGVDELMDRFESIDLNIIDLFLPDRPNACAKKRRA